MSLLSNIVIIGGFAALAILAGLFFANQSGKSNTDAPTKPSRN